MPKPQFTKHESLRMIERLNKQLMFKFIGRSNHYPNRWNWHAEMMSTIEIGIHSLLSKIWNIYCLPSTDRAECYCLSRHVLTVPSLSTSGISICPSRTSQLWLVNRFNLGILESLCRFQLLSFKRLEAWSKSQGAIELTLAYWLKAGRVLPILVYSDIVVWPNRRPTNSRLVKT